MTAAARKYGGVFAAQLASGLAYPLDLLGRSLSILVFLWVFLHLWRAVFAAAGGGAIEGLELADTLWYLMLAETIVLSKPRLSEEISRTVRDGSVALHLARPYHQPLFHISAGLADAVARALPTALVGGALTWAMVGPPPPVAGWPLAAAALVLGWLLDFCMSALIGLSAFVVEDATAFDWIYSKAVLVLGGVLLPLDFLPEGLGAVARALPFAYTVWAPARVFVDPDVGRFAALAGAQLAWLVVLAAALVAAWRLAVRRVELNGG